MRGVEMTRRFGLSALAAAWAMLVPVAQAGQGQSHDYSTLVGTSPAVVMTIVQAQSCSLYLRIWNVSTTATIWLSRAGAAGVSAPGSYPLMAGQFETFRAPDLILVNPLSAVATAAGTPLTVECF